LDTRALGRRQVVEASVEQPALLVKHVKTFGADHGHQIVEQRTDALMYLDGASTPVADLVESESDVVVPARLWGHGSEDAVGTSVEWARRGRPAMPRRRSCR